MSVYQDLARGHDWTGVFASTPTDRSDWMVLTACHRVDNVFYELAVVDHEVSPRTLCDFLPIEPPHDCASADICWMLDFYFDGDLADNREVTEAQAVDLLNTDIDGLKAHVAVGQKNHEAWVEKASAA